MKTAQSSSSSSSSSRRSSSRSSRSCSSGGRGSNSSQDSRSDRSSNRSDSRDSPRSIISVDNDHHFLDEMVGYGNNYRTFLRTFNRRRGRDRRQRDSRSDDRSYRFVLSYGIKMTSLDMYFILAEDTVNHQVNLHHQSRPVSAIEDLTEV